MRLIIDFITCVYGQSNYVGEVNLKVDLSEQVNSYSDVESNNEILILAATLFHATATFFMLYIVKAYLIQ